jgi:cyclopropane fatty-acyl-phospholipid synthase-like methyltransferase
MDSQKHWENVFNTKNQNEVSWYEPTPKISIAFFKELNISKDANIIDVGCGDSYFIDYLVAQKYNNIYALDISAGALEKAKIRLGENALNVHWIVSDILDFRPNISFHFWHDRASFHFQTETTKIQQYTQLVNKSVATNGYMVIGTFSENGPLKCSGLNIKQYSQTQLIQQFQQSFDKLNCITENHQTPFNTPQNFTFCSFQKS